MNKISIVGPGRVGESTAQILAKQELCQELVLIGIDDSVAKGIALDIQETAPLFRFDTRVIGGADVELIKNSDLVIITAGMPRKPGMSRDDLLDANIAITRDIMLNVAKHAPNAIIIMVSNPVDVLTYYSWKLTEWPVHRILGLSGVLDSARMASFIAMETGLSVADINALVLGGHGDAMVPLTRLSNINGVPISDLLDKNTIDRLVEHTRKGGAEILALKKTSSAYDSPAASIAAMVDAIVKDRQRILPCVAILNGEYGQQEIAMGVPVILSSIGVKKVIELDLLDEERAQLANSLHQLRQTIDAMRKRNLQ